MKKIVPIILVICTVLSVFSIFTVPAHAVVGEVVGTVLIGLGMFAIGELLGNIGQQSGEALASSFVEWQNQHNEFLHSNDSIQIEYHNNLPTFVVNPSASLSDVEYNITSEIVNELNTSMGGLESIWFDSNTMKWEMYPWAYENIKTTIANKVYQQMYAESQNKAIEDLISSGALPTYNFDFVGPSPSLEIPSYSYSAETFLKDGYTLVRPFQLTPETAPLNAGGIPTITNIYDNYSDYGLQKFGTGSFGCSFGFSAPDDSLIGMYVIYNDVIYSYIPSVTSSELKNYNAHLLYFNQFCSPDGVKLNAVASQDDVLYIPQGYFYVPKTQFQENQTQYISNTSSQINSDDFTSITPSSSMEIPRTDDENNVGLGMALGLIGNSDILELNPDGTIKSVGGIDMAKLTDLIGKVQSGNLGFENVQEYLELIAKYLATGNLTAQEQAKILANVQANVTSLADIKIKADYKFDVKTPDTIINKFPFSLPFDVYNIFNLLSAEPKTPKFTIPLEMKGVFKEEITVDLSQFDNIAFIVRWLLYIIFILGLILVTNKLIGRG